MDSEKAGQRKCAPCANSRTLTLEDTQLELIFKRDREIFGADRSFLLRSLRDISPNLAISSWRDGDLQGYAFGRSGLFADHLGPWVANSHASSRINPPGIFGPLVPRNDYRGLLFRQWDGNGAVALSRLYSARQLTRMFRGPNAHPGDREALMCDCWSRIWMKSACHSR